MRRGYGTRGNRDTYRYRKKIYQFRSAGPVRVKRMPNFNGVTDECACFSVYAGEQAYLKTGD